MGYRPASEFVEKAMEELERMKDVVQVREDENTLVLALEGLPEYQIPLDSIRMGPRGVLYWVLHLSEKTWFTGDVIERFIVVASDVAGFDPYSVVSDDE